MCVNEQKANSENSTNSRFVACIEDDNAASKDTETHGGAQDVCDYLHSPHACLWKRVFGYFLRELRVVLFFCWARKQPVFCAIQGMCILFGRCIQRDTSWTVGGCIGVVYGYSDWPHGARYWTYGSQRRYRQTPQ